MGSHWSFFVSARHPVNSDAACEGCESLAYQPHVQLFELSSLLQKMLNRLLHVSVGHQLLLSELCKVDDPTEVASEPV